MRKAYTVITKWLLKSLVVCMGLETLAVSDMASGFSIQTNSSGVRLGVRGQCFWLFEHSCPTTQQIKDIDVDFNRLTILFVLYPQLKCEQREGEGWGRKTKHSQVCFVSKEECTSWSEGIESMFIC